MAGIIIDIEDKKLKNIIDGLKPAIARCMNRANKSMAILAKDLAPEKTGHLKSSIHIEDRATAKSLLASTVADAEYAEYVEYGFVHAKSDEDIPAQPFMSPAYEEAKQQLENELPEVIVEALMEGK